MPNLPTRLLAAFAADPSGGNIGGVVYEDELLDPQERQQIAADLAVSTTGFVRDAGNGVYNVHFHSSVAEMAMCGHVTLAIFAALQMDGQIISGTYEQRTSAGDLTIEVADDGTVYMFQPRPVFGAISVKSSDVAALIGLLDGSIREVASSSTALQHLFIEVSDKDALRSLELDDAGLHAFSQSHGIDTIGVWSLISTGKGTAEIHLRDLCHGVGDPEEAASGTTNGALASHLWNSKRVKPDSTGKIKVTGWQGFEMGRPSRIDTVLRVGDQGVEEVRVGGTAELRLTGSYCLARRREANI